MEYNCEIMNITSGKPKKFYTPREKRILLQTLGKMPDTTFYSSNHVMVNKERVTHSLPILKRSRILDEVARTHALRMLDNRKTIPCLDEACLSQLKLKTTSENKSIVGLNVAYGRTIKDGQKLFMSAEKYRKKILNREFNRMGFATARDLKGRLYMCQLFSF